MTTVLTTTYVLKWQLSTAPNYKFDAAGICINTKTGKRIKKVLNGRSVGYCINGKFRSANSLRPHLTRIEHIDCPF